MGFHTTFMAFLHVFFALQSRKKEMYVCCWCGERSTEAAKNIEQSKHNADSQRVQEGGHVGDQFFGRSIKSQWAKSKNAY